ATAGAIAIEEAGDEPEREIEAADEVPERATAADRGPVWEPGDRHQPAARLGDDVVRHLAGPRTGCAEPRERRDDEARVAGAEHVGSEPLRLHPAGAEVLDDRVGALDEAQKDVAPLGVPDVERDRALAAVRVLEQQRG